MVVVNIS